MFGIPKHTRFCLACHAPIGLSLRKRGQRGQLPSYCADCRTRRQRSFEKCSRLRAQIRLLEAGIDAQANNANDGSTVAHNAARTRYKAQGSTNNLQGDANHVAQTKRRSMALMPSTGVESQGRR